MCHGKIDPERPNMQLQYNKKVYFTGKVSVQPCNFQANTEKKIHICGCKDFKLGPKRRGELQKYFLAKRSLNWTLGTHSLLIWTFKKKIPYVKVQLSSLFSINMKKFHVKSQRKLQT